MMESSSCKNVAAHDVICAAHVMVDGQSVILSGAHRLLQMQLSMMRKIAEMQPKSVRRHTSVTYKHDCAPSFVACRRN